jgi:hypothetical protein
MTEYELIDAYQSAEVSFQSGVSIFVTTIFAYLATAYFVGAKLTRTQVIIVSGLYTVFCAVLFMMIRSQLTRLTEFGTEILDLSPERTFADSRTLTGGLVLWGGVFLGAYLAGLIFMLQIRRTDRSRS